MEAKKKKEKAIIWAWNLDGLPRVEYALFPAFAIIFGEMAIERKKTFKQKKKLI